MQEDRRRFEAALSAIDAANRDDPNFLEVRGVRRPKELAHAELVSDWVRRLRPDAGEALLLAARAHHVRRWQIPRREHPPGRAGYLRWRHALQRLHASVTAEILRGVGYEEELVARVEAIVRKRGLGRDVEVQTFEDALCLTFLETQLADFAAGVPRDKAEGVLAKTLAKMSPAARDCARGLALPDDVRALLHTALDAASRP